MNLQRLEIFLAILSCLIKLNHSDSGLDVTKVTKALKYKTGGVDCWLVEKFIVVKSCKPCKELEKKLNPECEKTGYRQRIRCEKSNKEFHVSCSGVRSSEERKFWLFEAGMISMAFLSNIAIWIRRRKLDYYAYSKLQKQMSDSGV